MHINGIHGVEDLVDLAKYVKEEKTTTPQFTELLAASITVNMKVDVYEYISILMVVDREDIKETGISVEPIFMNDKVNRALMNFTGEKNLMHSHYAKILADEYPFSVGYKSTAHKALPAGFYHYILEVTFRGEDLLVAMPKVLYSNMDAKEMKATIIDRLAELFHGNLMSDSDIPFIYENRDYAKLRDDNKLEKYETAHGGRIVRISKGNLSVPYIHGRGITDKLLDPSLSKGVCRVYVRCHLSLPSLLQFIEKPYMTVISYEDFCRRKDLARILELTERNEINRYWNDLRILLEDNSTNEDLIPYLIPYYRGRGIFFVVCLKVDENSFSIIKDDILSANIYLPEVVTELLALKHMGLFGEERSAYEV